MYVSVVQTVASYNAFTMYALVSSLECFRRGKKTAQQKEARRESAWRDKKVPVFNPAAHPKSQVFGSGRHVNTWSVQIILWHADMSAGKIFSNLVIPIIKIMQFLYRERVDSALYYYSCTPVHINTCSTPQCRIQPGYSLQCATSDECIIANLYAYKHCRVLIHSWVYRNAFLVGFLL